ncbi:SDR family NAD(P)-dependent oxidoreductase [Bdellovibrio bacteriovorus]|uniref:Oxidoreductase n=1 Tax=Bdellovibrio bacteriovorus (strain ATCC 15356 / DSM 50701 / NCIMB 9529 / HD100) TaxID=264462 RepID=Q6MNE1_BDEBA|nr:SDR family NAD(P)-dependent oxidoreductase [Bdellovibrio bacteriovorus]AHZ86523.1 short-chain dehydrogenase [Bdellovibrio bacteriovorus]CAE79211.1 oxidoreductase [Bdellovibrio bacteriovorus HD100]
MMAKWALITGASSGIGWATAEALAAQGFDIFVTGRRYEKLQELEKAIKARHPKTQVKLACFDVSDRFEVSEFVKAHKTEISEVEILVNNAGLARGVEKMQDASLDDWEVMIDTNIKGLLFMTRAVVEHMVKKNSGHIINLGSVAGRWTYPGGGVYCATKFAVRALSEGLRMDLLGTKVRVTNIEPGMVNTEFSVVRLGDQAKADKVYEGMTPLSAQDIAETVAWCAARPAHVNIQELVIYPTDQAHVGQVARKGV